jgi:alpha-beta hydrolase superfamily lysophospholipase
MQHTEGSFRGVDGLELYCQAWRPEAAPRAVLAVTHGFGEHSGRYKNVVDHFVPRGYAVYGFDLRGHGRSPGKRGFIRSWSDYRGDTAAFLKMVAEKEPRRPLFLYGHSLGGLIVLDYVLHTPEGLKGVIASGPSLGAPGISPFLLAVSRILSVILPSFAMDTKLDATTISRDPLVVKAYKEDPLVHSMGTARLGGEMNATVLWTQAHAQDIRLPLLIVQGAEDRLAPAPDSRRFFDHVTYADKERIEYPGGFHEPHNDIEHPKVMADIERWVERHL